MSPAKRSVKVAWIIVGVVAVVVGALLVFGLSSNGGSPQVAESSAPAPTVDDESAPAETTTLEDAAPALAGRVDAALKASFVVESYQDTCGQEGLTWPCFVGDFTDAGDGKVSVWFSQDPEDPATVARNILTLTCQSVPELQGVVLTDLNQVPLAEVSRSVDGAGVC